MLQPDRLLPGFTAITSRGETLRSTSYRQRRNLLLIFLDRPERQDFLDALAVQHRRWSADNASVIAFLAYPPLTPPPDAVFPVVFDLARQFWMRFAIDSAAIVLTDRFSIVRKIHWLPETHPLPPVADVLDWLEFIDLRCPECNIPLW